MRLLPLLLAGCFPPGQITPADTQSDTETDADTDTDTDADTDADTDTDTDVGPPEWCEPASFGDLQHVTSHPTAPYWIWHPEGEGDATATVVFLPGGNGPDGAGPPTFDLFFARGEDLRGLRVVIVGATDGDLTDEWERLPIVTEEVLACYGGDGTAVHLAGSSNGGLGAFSIMLDAPDHFATLLGCPGVWQDWDSGRVLAALEGKRVFNGVGELDTSWKPYVQQTHAMLVTLGIDSTYHEFPDQGHVPPQGFDPSPLVDFWTEAAR